MGKGVEPEGKGRRGCDLTERTQERWHESQRYQGKTQDGGNRGAEVFVTTQTPFGFDGFV